MMIDAFSRVLIVDDERFWCDKVADILREETNFHVDWVQSIEECRKQLERNHYHVVIMDLDLNAKGTPDSGLDLTMELTGDYFIERDKFTVVIILSYHDHPNTRIKSYTAGSIHFHRKPKTDKEFELFDIEFPRMVESVTYSVENMRNIESSVSTPLDGDLKKYTIIINNRHTYVMDEIIELNRHLHSILRILMESRGPIPSAVLMRQTGIDRENTLHVYLSNIRRKLQEKDPRLQILSSGHGYYINFRED